MKASAIAYPIQGLVKYHGLRDPLRRIPYHDSVSVCTSGIWTQTTVEVGGENLVAEIDGKVATGRPLERLQLVLDAIQEEAGQDAGCKIVSRNSFPQFVGLGSSSSGFAALAVAAAKAYGVDATPKILSQFARLGAGSASRAVTGGVSKWLVRGEASWSEMIGAPAEFPDWKIIVPLIHHEVPTDGVHADATTSPLFAARVAYVPKQVEKISAAVAEGDVEKIWQIAEEDTLNLHAITMTGASGLVTWQPGTIEIMHTVRQLRGEGIPVYFSIDTGATPYLNCHKEDVEHVGNRVQEARGVRELLHLGVGGPATLVGDHLF